MANSLRTSRQQLIEQYLTSIDPCILEVHEQTCWICHQVMLPAKQDRNAAAESQKLGSDSSTAESPEQTITDAATDESIHGTQNKQEADGDDRSAVRLACRHTFCKSCISQWLSIAETCPECRTKLFTAPNRVWEEWQREREGIIHTATEIIRERSRDPWPITFSAERLRRFIMDETSYDRLPSGPMWALVRLFGSVPLGMTDRVVKIAIDHFEQMLSGSPDMPVEMRRDIMRVLDALTMDLLYYEGMLR